MIVFAKGGDVSANSGDDGKAYGLASQLYASGNDQQLGSLFDQRFYAVRARPGDAISFPFREHCFNALIDLSGSFSAVELRETILQLLRRGMRVGVCGGNGAGRVGDLIDELVDEYGFSHDGGTVYSDVHEGESLEDVVGYFVTPNGLAEVGFIIILGDDEQYGYACDAVTMLTDGAECVAEAELELAVLA